MTAPVVHGYADWQVQAAQQDIVYIIDTAIPAPTKTYPSIFVGTTRALNVALFSLLGRFRITIEYFDSSLNTNSMGKQEAIINSLGSIQSNITNLGPWAQISVTAGVGGSTYTISVGAAALSGNHQLAAGNSVLITTVGQAIGIAGTVTLESAITFPGPAIWSMHQAAGTCQVSMHYTDEHGTVVTMNRKILVAGADVDLPVFLPPCPVGLQIFNSSGAATNFDAYLNARPDLCRS